MKNKEKYAKEIVECALNGDGFLAINKRTGEPGSCFKVGCENCDFRASRNGCVNRFKEWAESEYKEPITAERLREEFNQMCSKNAYCDDCKYYVTNCNDGCRYAWLLEHYDVTKKEKKNEE